MKKIFLFSIFLLSGIGLLNAQNKETLKAHAVQIQLDVLGFAQSGFGVVGGYINGKNRIDIDLLTNTLFDSFTNGSQDFEDIFNERRSVMTINYYRYLKNKGLGFYYGAGLSYYEYIVEHESLNETVATNAYKPGIYIGYDVIPFSRMQGFYVDVWLGARWHWESEEEFPYSNGEYYKIPNLDAPLGMIKLGWRFNTGR